MKASTRNKRNIISYVAILAMTATVTSAYAQDVTSETPVKFVSTEVQPHSWFNEPISQADQTSYDLIAAWGTNTITSETAVQDDVDLAAFEVKPANFEPEFSGYCPPGFGDQHVKVGTVQQFSAAGEILRVNRDALAPTNLYNEPVAYVAGLQLSL